MLRMVKLLCSFVLAVISLYAGSSEQSRVIASRAGVFVCVCLCIMVCVLHHCLVSEMGALVGHGHGL